MLQLEADRNDWESREPYQATHLKGTTSDSTAYNQEPAAEEKATDQKEGGEEDEEVGEGGEVDEKGSS